MNLVKVARLGQKVKEVSLEDIATIEDALKSAGESGAEGEIRLNGEVVEGTDVNVRDGDVIALVPQINGGA